MDKASWVPGQGVSAALWIPGKWGQRREEAQRKQEGEREGGRKGGQKGGDKGSRRGWGGGKGTQGKSEVATGLLPCPTAQCHPPLTLRTESSQLTLSHTIFTLLQSIVTLSSLSLSP